MAKKKMSISRAIRELRECQVHFSLYFYKYEEKRGTPAASRELNVDQHLIIKTIVMEDGQGDPFLVLMHGDKKVSIKAMARAKGVKAVRTCEPPKAHQLTGYYVGGISPFGTKKALSVYVETSVLNLEKIYINAGRKGLLAGMSPQDLVSVLNPIYVNVAVENQYPVNS
ncbi:MAG: Cys-tRNA(Pro) deacylase [Deltaproteobacteria bacterium]|nr:Cys-tRNA(Pro) deacylase [Deltaproteobacteria bacterium]